MKLESGRRYLWQWELNQKLIVEENCTIVQYGNGTMTNALGVEVREQDGVRYAEIPNILLQTAADLCAWAWDEETGSVVGHAVFGVVPMPKPAQYAYTQTEVKQYDLILESMMFQKGTGLDSIVRIVSDAAEKPEAQPTATGESAISLGRYCQVPGKNAMAVNYNNQVDATYGFAANNRNKVASTASSGTSFGSRNEVYAPLGFAAGWINTILAEAKNGFLTGEQNVLKVPNGARFGQWCDEESDALFAVGNGDRPSNRSDAFAVFMDGSMALNKEVFTAKEIRLAITRAATMAEILLSNEKAIFTAEELRSAITNVGKFTVEELRQTVNNVAKFSPEQIQTVIDYVAAYPASIISTVVDKSAMMSPIVHAETGETVPILTALQLQGLSVFGKTTQEGEPAPENPAEIFSTGDDGSIDLSTQMENGQLVVLRIPTPDGLLGIPAANNYNYNDENGQKWICDEIDVGRKVRVQRVGSITLDGSEAWNFENGYTNVFSCSLVKSRNSYIGLSDKMITATNWSKLISTPFSFGLRTSALTINLGDEINTVEAAKAWLAEKRPTVLYALDSPIETPLEALYKSEVISFAGGSGNTVSNGYEADTWSVPFKAGTTTHQSSCLQGHVFSVSHLLVVEIKNEDNPGVYDMEVQVPYDVKQAGAEVYFLPEAPSDGWSSAVVDTYTTDSPEFVGVLDCANAEKHKIAFRRNAAGNFFLLFKGTDLDTNPSGNLRLQSLSMEQVEIGPCLENKSGISATAEGAGLSVTYAADTKTYIDHKFSELQKVILSAGANS